VHEGDIPVVRALHQSQHEEYEAQEIQQAIDGCFVGSYLVFYADRVLLSAI